MLLSLVTLSRARPGRKKKLFFNELTINLLFLPLQTILLELCWSPCVLGNAGRSVFKLSSKKSLSFTKIFQKSRREREEAD